MNGILAGQIVMGIMLGMFSIAVLFACRAVWLMGLHKDKKVCKHSH